MNHTVLSHLEVDRLAKEAAAAIDALNLDLPVTAYAIPRGGIAAAYAIGRYTSLTLTDNPRNAKIIIDDLIDSGETMKHAMDASRRWGGASAHPIVLIDKTTLPEGHYLRNWIVFPWEGSVSGSAEDNVRRLLQFIGENPDREGLKETPKRFIKAWKEWTAGYDQDPAELLKTFEDGAEGTTEMVMVRDINFNSKCEHHLADIFGTATVAYIPDGRIVGLSKLNRVVNTFARRLQVQERFTCQIADAIHENLGAKGVGVIVKARHMCMESRGICQHGHSTVTSALRGVFMDGTVRQEFLHLAK